MNIDIICVGNIKEKYFIDAIKEYTKRLAVYINLNIIEIAEHKISNRASEKDISNALKNEKEIIKSKIREKSFIISLVIEGRQFTSEKFSEKIEELALEGYSDITFIIGSSYGLDNEIKNMSDLKLSFSKMTFPHQLMRVVLLEQIYRAFRIIRNEPYHK